MNPSARHRARRSRRWQWVGWRFRRCQPGMVWVSDKEYVELLKLKVRELRAEADIARYGAEVSGYRAVRRASDLLAGVSIQSRTELLNDIPLTVDGHLHERALFALVDQDSDIARLLAG